jgi:hypothetical protein
MPMRCRGRREVRVVRLIVDRNAASTLLADLDR